jgi:MoaA/NifB/PqqE/SkfB family radical SAM enzyme
MCDIWKGNNHLRQLTEDDILGLLGSLRKFGVRQVLMSGGEAMLHLNFFRFCEILRKEKIRITLLSTGLTLKKNAEKLVSLVNDVIVSLDGHEPLHDSIRNIPGAFQKLKEGVEWIRTLDSGYKITGRTVIHRLNYKSWPLIVESARKIGLDQISFLPADVTSHAFNREILWDLPKQKEILIPKEELPALHSVIDGLIEQYAEAFRDRFIAENPDKIRKIFDYYAAFYGLNPFPYKKCNAPWVSTVIEADGTVRPCFFHPPLGNVREQSLDRVLNSGEAVKFRKTLDIDTDPVCMKCVCYLNLPPHGII